MLSVRLIIRAGAHIGSITLKGNQSQNLTMRHANRYSRLCFIFMLNSTEHEISVALKTKALKDNTCIAFKYSYVVFIMLINVKCQQLLNCGHFSIYEHDKAHSQSR